MTTPGALGEASQRAATVDALDDVFGSAPPSPVSSSLDDENGHLGHLATTIPSSTARATDPSDMPRLRATHVTNGYRDGIAVSKETSLQRGFDDGYAVGAALALRAGWCLGALEGLCCAARMKAEAAAGEVGHAEHHRVIRGGTDSSEHVRRLLTDATAELGVARLFAAEYFGVDGEPRFVVPEGGDRGLLSVHVADAHPLVKKWRGIVTEATHGLGLTLKWERAVGCDVHSAIFGP